MWETEDKVGYLGKRKQVESSSNQERTKAARVLTNNDSSVYGGDSSLLDSAMEPVRKLVRHISYRLVRRRLKTEALKHNDVRLSLLLQRLPDGDTLDLDRVLDSNLTVYDKEIFFPKWSHITEDVCSDIVCFLETTYSSLLQVQFDFDIQSIVSHLESADSHTQLSQMKELRKWFSGFIFEIDDLESVDVCLLLETIKQTMETSGSQELKSEVDATLIHIISEYLLRYTLEPVFAIKQEVVQVLLDLLETDSFREKAVEELRKVAFNVVSRDNALRHGALDALLKQLETANVSMLRKLTFTISSLCGGYMSPPFSKAKLALKPLRKLIDENADQEVLSNACAALSYICGTTDLSNGRLGWIPFGEEQSTDYASEGEIANAFREADVLPVLVKLLSRESATSIIFPAFGTLQAICKDYDKNEILIREGEEKHFLDCLSSLLERELEEEMVCATIALITCESTEWGKAVYEAGLIDHVCILLQKKEIMGIAAVAIACTIDGIVKDRQDFFARLCIKPLCNYIDADDKFCVEAGLIGMEKLLKLGVTSDNNFYRKTIKELVKFKGMEGENLSRVKEMEKKYRLSE